MCWNVEVWPDIPVATAADRTIYLHAHLSNSVDIAEDGKHLVLARYDADNHAHVEVATFYNTETMSFHFGDAIRISATDSGGQRVWLEIEPCDGHTVDLEPEMNAWLMQANEDYNASAIDLSAK